MSYSTERYYLYKKLNMCVNCGNQDAYTFGGRALCQNCAEKEALRKKQRDKSLRQAQRKTLRQKHIENHECVVCGKLLPKDYKYKSCTQCRVYNKLRQRTDKTFTRGEYGVCYLCNKEQAMDGKRLCKKCYEKIVVVSLQNLTKVNLKKHIWKKQIIK